jgi:hypothetical protein
MWKNALFSQLLLLEILVAFTSSKSLKILHLGTFRINETAHLVSAIEIAEGPSYTVHLQTPANNQHNGSDHRARKIYCRDSFKIPLYM